MAKRRDNRFNPRKTSKKIHSFEREIIRLGKRQFGFMREFYRENFLPNIKLPYLTIDADEKEIERLRSLLEKTTREGLSAFQRRELERKIQDVMKRIDATSLVEVEKVAGKEVFAVFNKEIDGIIKRSVKDTVSGLQDVGKQTEKNLARRITAGIVSGERHESIAKGIRGMLDDGSEEGSAVNRAKFIARNTVSTALGEINMERQKSLGIELYYWQTAEDDRVRPTHEELGRHGQNIYSWDGNVKVGRKTYKPAVDEQYSDSPTFPGQPWNCRCVALAYIPELED